MKKKIALIFGGRSAEHEVSLNSARNIYNAIDTAQFEAVLLGVSKQGGWYHFSGPEVFERKSLNDSELPQENAVSLLCHRERPYIHLLSSGEKIAIDCAFPIIHGTMGEDGTLQGFFKILNLPFVGCGVLSSAVGMDKDFMKRLLTEAKIPNSRYVVLHKDSPADYNQIAKELGTPFFIKPANAGSSVGVHKIKSEKDFPSQLADAFQYDHKVIAEEFMDGREIECAVLGTNAKPRASLPGELVVKHEFYSYEAKYLDENGAEILIPAPLAPSETDSIRALAERTFTALGCNGLTRVDFFLRQDGRIFVNEINTLPGFTKISMYPKMWEASGLTYSSLITELVQIAFERHAIDSRLRLNF